MRYRVEGEIAANFSAAARDLGEIGFLEVDAAPRAHVECAESEVYGIGACVYRGLKASEVPGWGKNLWTFHGQVMRIPRVGYYIKTSRTLMRRGPPSRTGMR